MFTTHIGTALRSNNLLRRSFRPLLERAGLRRIRVHDLRHGHAAHLPEAEEHPNVVSERLGHSQVEITLDLHSHVCEPLQQAAADKTEAALRGAGRRG